MAFLNSVFQRADTFIKRIGEVVAPVEGPAQELQIAIKSTTGRRRSGCCKKISSGATR